MPRLPLVTRVATFLTVAALALAPLPASAQLSTTEIDSLVERSLRQFNVVGAAVAVVQDGAVVHNRGYGVSALSTGAPVTEHTAFEIASNTKAFTTAALSILVDEGSLKWTDAVVDYIPEFRMYDPYVTESFNVQDLLTHRSGLGLGAGDLMFFPSGGDYTIEDLLVVFQHFEPVSAFRTKYDYDNLLYVVAGELIERVSGLTWKDFVQTRIIDAIGMDESYATSALATERHADNLAAPHITRPSGEQSEQEAWPRIWNGAPGAIVASVDDLSRWMRLQLNGGVLDGDTLWSARQQAEMWRVHTPIPSSGEPRYNSHFRGYGLGWHLRDAAGSLEVSHTGGLPGMLSKTLLLPDQNVGIVVLTNTSGGGGSLFSAVSQTIADSYLGLDPVDWVGRYAEVVAVRGGEADSIVEAVWAEVERADASVIDAQEFVGMYEDPWFGGVEISEQGGGLYFTALRSPKLRGPLRFYQGSTFALAWATPDLEADALVTFGLGEDGRAVTIGMRGLSPEIDFSYDFHDLRLSRVK